MHKLMDYVCDELDELERKADKGGKLSMSDIQYADTLAHLKKNMLKAEEMEGAEYSGAVDGMSYRRMYDDGSYARGRGRNARRDAMGRYSSDGYSRRSEDFKAELHDLMRDAPNDHVRQKMQNLMAEM